MRRVAFAFLSLATFVSFSSIADDIYRCPSAGGATVYQANPCKGGVNKAGVSSGAIAKTEAEPKQAQKTEAEPKPVQSDMERSKAYLSQREKERKKDDLQAKIARNEEAIRGYQNLMHAEIELLQAKKGLAKNNLAGATWEESLSTEMNALTARYRSEIDIRQEENKVLRAELSKL